MITWFEIAAAQKKQREKIALLKKKYAAEVEKAGPAVRQRIEKIFEEWERKVEEGDIRWLNKDRSEWIELQLRPSKEYVEYCKERKLSAETAIKILDSKELDIEELKAAGEKGKLHEYFPKDNEDLSDEKYEHYLGWGVTQADDIITKRENILGIVYTREELEEDIPFYAEIIERAK